jgi:hypothetical protein
MESMAYKAISMMLEKAAQNPENLTDEKKEQLKKMRSMLNRALAFSEHVAWEVHWRVEKFKSKTMESVLAIGEQPYEVCSDVQNIILDTGANEMLKLIGGVSGATAFSAANAKIYVGSDSTAEAASQTGVIATVNKAFSAMDSGYPTVSGRTIVFRASFDDSTANFAWNEAAITNGSGAGAIAMNRKVASLGTKTTGTWTLQLTISLTSV